MNNQQQNYIPNYQVPPTPVNKAIQKGTSFARKIFLTIALLTGTLLAIFVVYLILFFTNFDLQIFQLNFSGTVVAGELNEPVKNTSIFLNNKEIAKTDEQGKFTTNEIKFGDNLFEIKAEGFEPFQETVSINKSLFTYSYSKVFNIAPGKNFTAILKGKLVTTDKTYTFVNDSIFVNDQKFSVNRDGTFELTKIATGSSTFKFESFNFKDVTLSIELKEGVNELEDINIEPAGDINAKLLSYVENKFVENSRIEVQGTTENQLLIDKEQKDFRVKDLEIGNEYLVRFSALSYLTRDYKVTVKQGTNIIENFKIVEDDTIYFTRRKERSSDINIYSSKADGSEFVQLTSQRTLNPTNIFYQTDGKIYFQSSYENLRSELRSERANPVYELNSDTKKFKRATSAKGIGLIFPNYLSGMAVNVVDDPSNRDKTLVQTMNINGSNKKPVYSFNEPFEIVKAFISKDNKFIVLSLIGNRDERKLIHIDLTANTNRTISEIANLELHDMSDVSSKVIFSAKKDNFNDLYYYDPEKSETRTLINNYSGKNAQFVNNSDTEIIFSVENNAHDNIENFSLSQNKVNNLITLINKDKVASLYQDDNFIFYKIGEVLYIATFQNPQNYVNINL